MRGLFGSANPFDWRVTSKESIMKTILILAGLTALLMGCGSTGGGSSATESRDVLTAQEIATTNAQNAYEAVTMKRPWFLQSRGPRSLTHADQGQTTEYPVVYLDGVYYGDIESLRQIPVVQVREIRFYDMSSATLQFGAGHTGGVIQVLSKPR